MRETPLPFLDIIENQNKKGKKMPEQVKAVANNLAGQIWNMNFILPAP